MRSDIFITRPNSGLSMKRAMNPFTAVAPCPVVLLSVSGKEKPNIITLSWVVNVCSNPPTIVAGIRPERFSYDLVKDAKEFDLNIPSTGQFEGTEFAGTKSGKDYDKFAECGFTPEPATKINAPMIKECPINIECKTTQVIELGAHHLFIAEIVAVHIDEDALDEKGRFDNSKAPLFTYLPLTGQYWILGEQLQ